MSAAALQSTFEGASTQAALVDDLGLVMTIVFGVTYAGVLLATVLVLRAPAAPVRARAWLLCGGVALPLVVVTALFIASLRVTHAIAPRLTGTPLRIHVTGRQWWWEVLYLSGAGSPGVALANELHVPVGEAVELLLASDDVIHSFWVPALGGKMDMIPGLSRRLVLEPVRAGVFRAQCAEYCGMQHALMALVVVAEPPAQFRAWLERQAQPAPAPADAALARGRELFFEAGCDECHTVRGTRAGGRGGPDLTHVGSRLSLGAVALGNGKGELAGWIAGNQALKPGNHMPGDNPFDGAELRALAAWLASLR